MSDDLLTSEYTQKRIALFLEASLPFWWADLENECGPDLCERARAAAWRFHGGDDESGLVGGEGLASGQSESQGRQLNALAEMVACITINESRQDWPRPVRLFGRRWEYPGRSIGLPGEAVGSPVGFEAYMERLLSLTQETP